MKFFINMYLYSMASVIVFGFAFLSIGGYCLNNNASQRISGGIVDSQIYTAISIDYSTLNADSALS